jgi:hypothetical protein
VTVSNFTLPDASGNATKTLVFPVRVDGQGNPVIECRDVKLIHMSVVGSTLDVTWEDRVTGTWSDPETLSQGARASTCRCNDGNGQLSVTANGGQVTFSIESCEPEV